MNAWLTWMKMFLLAVTFLAASSSAAWAVLGEGADSIVADQQEIGGNIKTISNSDYTINEITTPSGTVVREYVSPDERVFAVTWRGPIKPNLADLLGSYFQQIQAAAAAQKPELSRPRTVTASDVIFHSGGHMRNFWGRAVVPSLVPEGVSEAELK
jgi:hypothetical protein